MMIAGRYKPIGAIAAGGMGEIIECDDTHLQRRVVIKRLQKGIEERRLLDEQKALANLRSKHVVQLFDVVQLTDRHQSETGIVLEYIEGKDLEAGSFNFSRKYIHTLWQIACGLCDIHAAGVIHRDIKLNNIRVDREGVVKIFDFGLARSQDVAKTQGVVGTPRFIAPELWSSNTVIFDNAVDIYAFGVLALALLNKVLPTELVDLPPKQISRPAIAVSLMGAPKSMVDLLHRCLDHAPSNRPRMEEVQSVLREQLLKNQHRALVAFSNTVHQLDRNNKVINLNATTIGSIGISYTGTEFVISSVTGSVFLNNANATTGQIVPGCCVITFGTQGRSRQFVTFDVSTPEVMP